MCIAEAATWFGASVVLKRTERNNPPVKKQNTTRVSKSHWFDSSPLSVPQKHKWEPMENYDFFKNLEELLKFLNMYGFSEETT